MKETIYIVLKNYIISLNDIIEISTLITNHAKHLQRLILPQVTIYDTF